MPNNTSQQLQNAYTLIQTGDHAAARQILQAVIKTEPRNTDAWWLLAHAFPDTERRIKALKHILTLDPDHTRARDLLHRLTGQHHPPTTPAPRTTPDAATSGQRPIALLALVVLVLIGLGGGIFIALNGSPADDDAPNADSAAQIDTLAPQPSTANDNTTPAPPPTTTPRATLPPQLIPTETIPATVLTNTPRPTLQLPPSPTPGLVFAPSGGSSSGDDEPDAPNAANTNPTGGAGAAPQLGSDYWYGFDRAMTQSQINGEYYRFYDFPVSVWVGQPPNPNWGRYVDDAIRQVGQVVPLERTSNEGSADIILDFAPGEEVTRFCGGTSLAPQQVTTIGCGGMTYDRDQYAVTRVVDYIGFAFIAIEQATDMQARVVILHELLHAVGISVHSQDPRDIMYYQYGTFGDRQNATMTERDYNTLQRLYNSPAFGADNP